MFRISHKGEGTDDADTLDGVRAIVRGQSPGRYDVDQIREEPSPSGHTSQSWARMIREPDRESRKRCVLGQTGIRSTTAASSLAMGFLLTPRSLPSG